MSDEYLGDVLRVDLSKGGVERFTLGEDTLRKYLGGTGLGAKLLYDEVKPGEKWSDPVNRLLILAGPLNGTPIGGSGSVTVVSKGPLTNGAGCSQANGFFGAFLRRCGLYGILIQGAADELKYLYVEPESAELRNAEWLRAIDTYKTVDAMRSELGRRERDVSIASIGPAGEKMVRFAGIFFDYGHSASHNGLGAVMGSKKLKAVAVARGDKEVPMKNPEEVKSIAKKLIENVKTQSRGVYEYGTLNGLHTNAQRNMIPVKNYSTSEWKIDEEKARRICQEKNLLHPAYKHCQRLGCFTCPKQSLHALRQLWKYYPKEWNQLKKYVKDSPVPFRRKPGTNVIELEKKFEKGQYKTPISVTKKKIQATEYFNIQ